MNICILGLGYVGVVTGACLAKEGHDVTGVDVSGLKVDSVNQGRSPIVEEGLEELVADGRRQGRLKATTSSAEGLRNAEIAIVCVGTPSRRDGSLDDRYVRKVSEEIGEQLRARDDRLLVVFRSTMVPGTVRSVVRPILEQVSGGAAGRTWDLVFHPEFLREGSSIQDFYNPPKILVGCDREESGRRVLALYGEHIEAPRIVCSVETAETVKYCDNLFHAVKVTFANEVGQFCHALGIDSRESMRIFCQDRKLNISEKYLRPGFAFGGSCLPKDLRAFLSIARSRSLRLPMLEGILPSNQSQIERVLHMVLDSGCREVGFFGLAFKEGTDDLRESPYVELAEFLLGKGFRLICYDAHVQFARLIGGNRSFVEEKFPHLAEFLTDRIEDLGSAELVLLCHRPTEEVMRRLEGAGTRILDLTGMAAGSEGSVGSII